MHTPHTVGGIRGQRRELSLASQPLRPSLWALSVTPFCKDPRPHWALVLAHTVSGHRAGPHHPKSGLLAGGWALGPSTLKSPPRESLSRRWNSWAGWL